MKMPLLHFFYRIPKLSILFITLIIINFVISIYYIENDREKTILANKAVLIEQIGKSLEMLEDNPVKNYGPIAKITETERLKVRMTKSPLYPIQIHNNYLIHVSNLMKKTQEQLTFSVKIDEEYWANYEYKEKNYQAYVKFGLVFFETFIATIMLITLSLIERFRKPLKYFKKMAEKLGVEASEESHSLEYAPSIVRETRDAMKNMQKRIQKLLSDRTRLLAAISHDLRTPITRMKMRCQLDALSTDMDNLRDLDEMANMIDQILDFFKDASPTEDKSIFDLSTLLLTLCDETMELGHVIHMNEIPNGVAVKGKMLSIKRAISNVLQNALKYGNTVWVRLETADKKAVITIEDDGPGISEEEITKVFAPFYRADKSSSKKVTGTGLGLAIVQDILLAHNAAIRLENRQEGGLRAFLEFPLMLG